MGDGDKGIQKGEILVVRTSVDHLEIVTSPMQNEKDLKIVYNDVGLGDICSFPLGEGRAYFFNRPKTLKIKWCHSFSQFFRLACWHELKE